MRTDLGGSQAVLAKSPGVSLTPTVPNDYLRHHLGL